MYASSSHIRRVAAAVARVKEMYERKVPFRIYHGSTNSTRILSFKRDEMLDMSAFDHVLHVDKATRTVVAEPNVPMDKLVRATLKQGLVPPVVMEFPGITVGGGVQGGAGESSSFRYGCFNQTCKSYEMILADGSVVRAAPDENADLYYGTAGSYGTLGVMASAEIALIPARKYVELTYLPVASFAEMVRVTKRACKTKPDYVDGIMFSAHRGVVMVARLTDVHEGRVVRFTRARDEWFYLHAEQVLARVRAAGKSSEPYRESVPLVDYLFRYDRGAFWVGRFGFEMAQVKFSRFNRFVLDWILRTRNLYKVLQESGESQLHVVQDLALPHDKAVEFMEFVDRELEIYPLWICPLLPDTNSPLQSNNLDTPSVINIGVWGARIPSRERFLQANRAIEHKLIELGGKKWFYAHSYYSEKEFWKLYGRRWYNALRRKYKAGTLPSVYDKVSVKNTYPISLKRGILRTITWRAGLRIK